MKINYFSVEKLHEVIDAEIDFYDDLTIIVGMNGSGKTSILNLISDIVRFDTVRLLETQFSNARLDFIDDVNRYSVNFESGEHGISVTVLLNGQNFKACFIPRPTKANIGIDPASWVYKSFGFDSIGQLPANSFSVEFKSDESQIREICNSIALTFLRVDRTLAASDASGNVSIEDSGVRAAAALRGRKADNPIEVVLRVTTKHYTEYKNNLEKIRTKAYQSALSLSFSDDLFDRTDEKFSVGQFENFINELQRQVKLSSAMPKDGPLLEEVGRYFANSKTLLRILKDEKADKSSKALEGVLKSRQTRITKLLRIFETEQAETKSAYDKIDTYLKTLNVFFEESGKEIRFGEKTNALGFLLLNKSYRPKNSSESNDDDDLRPLDALSSGERQLLIVITYLCFMTKSPGIYVIDEPELSLHLSWQRELLRGLNAVRPEKSQIILATHTPEIVGQSPEKLAVLHPAYHDVENLGDIR
ncbi:AAA family ATPase [Burkholderia cenocepacia]|uniref:AAA family ATPase n=1 Tax=Burkholderia cenocepacia TaxID=95486 RepID=UPI002AB79730|nr:AAA family ATPase [Burkholderia cenocepacia]